MDEFTPDGDVEALAELFGVESTNGFHVEFLGRATLGWSPPRRGDGTRFPCIDDRNAYSGCLGSRCNALSCWAGDLVPSAYHATLKAPLPIFEVKGAKCHTCRHAVDGPAGRVECSRGHFDQPISVACLVRRRLPESVTVPCPDYEAAETLRPEVEEYRRRRRKQHRTSPDADSAQQAEKR